jgi:drug/metabolite transporter (DMT)-like permease
LAAPDNRAGVLAMVAAVACFTSTDVLMKKATEELAVSQVLALRGVVAVLLVFLFLRAVGGLSHPRFLLHPRVLVRSGLETAMILAYVSALKRAPFADVFSILQSAPILVTAYAAAFRGERVGLSRWAAVLLGFAGVLLIARPSPTHFEPAMGLALLAVVFVTGRDIATRAVPPHIPSQMVTLATTMGSMTAGFLLAPVETWRAPSQEAWLLLAAAGLAVALGNYAIIQAYRLAEMSVVSPIRYVGVPVAIVLGYLVWGQTPDALALAGIVVLVSAGVYMVRGEARRKSPAAR